MADAVWRDEVVQRLAAASVGDDEVDRLVVAVGEERGTRVRRKRLDVARAVVFLVLPRLLVLLQEAGEVVLGVERGDDASLRVRAHRLAVGVELRLGVAHERAVGDERVEGLARLGIRLGRRAVGPVGQVYLRARDMQEALGVSGREGLRLGRVHHIIRNGQAPRPPGSA